LLLTATLPSYVKPPAISFSHAAIDDHVMNFPLPASGGDQHPTVTVTHHHQITRKQNKRSSVA
jgi:hypothetical protein